MENRLRIIMAIKKMSISKLANLSGLSRTTISDIYHERSDNPSLQTLIKVSKALGVTLDELISIRR